MTGQRKMSQDHLFYAGVWSRDVEKVVLQKLRTARLDISLATLEWKYQQWARKYVEFSDLIGQPNLRYNSSRNKVDVKPGTRSVLAVIKPDYLIYKEEGEAEWGLLIDVYSPVIEVSLTSEQTGFRAGVQTSAYGCQQIINVSTSATRSFSGNVISSTYGSDVVDQPRESTPPSSDSTYSISYEI
ncbi:hypothetical protein C2S52_000667 [Perilla frutescens var. hirtella]|nr:hypothetical protein C2S52_000667 [Perilla frutescens var. hirtella]